MADSFDSSKRSFPVPRVRRERAFQEEFSISQRALARLVLHLHGRIDHPPQKIGEDIDTVFAVLERANDEKV